MESKGIEFIADLVEVILLMMLLSSTIGLFKFKFLFLNGGDRRFWLAHFAYLKGGD